MNNVISILNKRPERRDKHDVEKIIPIVKNVNLFHTLNNEQNKTNPNLTDEGETCEKLTHDDMRFIAKNMKYKFVEAGDNCINYGDFGQEFFIIIKGKC